MIIIHIISSLNGGTVFEYEYQWEHFIAHFIMCGYLLCKCIRISLAASNKKPRFENFWITIAVEHIHLPPIPPEAKLQ